MKIPPLNPAGAGQEARESRTASEAHRARWRTELELAQWQSRLRYRSQAGDGQRATGTPAAAVTVADHPAVASSPPPAGADRPLATGHQAVARLDSVLPQTLRGPAGSVSPGMVASGEAATAVASSALRAEMPSLRAPMNAQKAAAPLPFEQFQWPATASHVHLQGNRLNVALRDPRIDERDWPALHDRLQAQCNAWGLELGDLTINGKRVGSGGPTRD